jgi:cytosine/adenosine deaminase-related metal-dependent hydrolase
VILVRTDGALTAPVSDPAGAVLLQAGAGEIETVIVDGRLRKHEGRLVDPDAAAVFARLQSRAEEMAEAARRG